MNFPAVPFVRECLHEEGGRLFWLSRPRSHFATEKSFKTWNSRFAGTEAGYLNRRKNGDVRWLVCVGAVMLLRYQIVWAVRTGEWPGQLDHKNRNSLDDHFENLRPANQSQNMANGRKRINNKSGFKGVRWREKTGKWQAMIRVDYKTTYLGQYDTAAEAHQAYLRAAKEKFGEFACAG